MNFVIGSVPDEFISEAKRMRSERDKLYGNIYREERTDLRWVGEIGEICFNRWVRRNTSLPVKWILEEAAGSADFIIGTVPVGMKTVKRRDPVRSGYTAQITAKHMDEPVEQFFFASYEYPNKRLSLLGGIEKGEFRRLARYYGAGDQVHPNYTVRRGHEIWNIDISHLTPPMQWISSLSNTSDG